MRINSAPIFARMIDLEWTRQYTCAKAEISRDFLRKIERNQEIFDLLAVKKLCLSLGIKPIEVMINGVALTQTQGTADLGDGKRPPTSINGHEQKDFS